MHYCILSCICAAGKDLVCVVFIEVHTHVSFSRKHLIL